MICLCVEYIFFKQINTITILFFCRTPHICSKLWLFAFNGDRTPLKYWEYKFAFIEFQAKIFVDFRIPHFQNAKFYLLRIHIAWKRREEICIKIEFIIISYFFALVWNSTNPTVLWLLSEITISGDQWFKSIKRFLFSDNFIFQQLVLTPFFFYFDFVSIFLFQLVWCEVNRTRPDVVCVKPKARVRLNKAIQNARNCDVFRAILSDTACLASLFTSTADWITCRHRVLRMYSWFR